MNDTRNRKNQMCQHYSSEYTMEGVVESCEKHRRFGYCPCENCEDNIHSGVYRGLSGISDALKSIGDSANIASDLMRLSELGRKGIMDYISLKDFLEITSKSVQMIITQSNTMGVSIKGYPDGLKHFLKNDILEKKIIRIDMISEGCVNVIFE